MSDQLMLTKKIRFSMANKGRRQIKPGPPGPAPVIDATDGRIPRIARLMALAIKFDQMITSGAIRDQAELAEPTGLGESNSDSLARSNCSSVMVPSRRSAARRSISFAILIINPFPEFRSAISEP